LPGLSGIDLLKSIRVAGGYLTKPVNKQSILRAVATAARFSPHVAQRGL
jgi:hypothetical protein